MNYFENIYKPCNDFLSIKIDAQILKLELFLVN